MYVNSHTNDDLDLNSDSVPLDDQNKVSMVPFSESTITVTVSATETLTETSTGQNQAEGSSCKSVIDEVRVCSREGNSVEALVQGADVCVDAPGDHGVEGNLNEDAGHDGLVKEGLETDVESVDKGGDETEGDKFDVMMSEKVVVAEYDDQKTGIEVAKKVEFSTTITELLGEQDQAVVEGEAAVMDIKEALSPKVEVPGTDALDVNLSCSEIDQKLMVGIVNGSSEKDSNIHEDPPAGVESIVNADLRPSLIGTNLDGQEENTSMQDEKKEMGAEVAETLSIQVDGDRSGDSHPIEEIPDQGTCVTVNSNSHAENTVGSQAAVAFASPHGEGEPDSSQDAGLAGPLPDSNPNEEVQGVESIVNGDLRTSVLGKNSDGEEENTFMQDEKQEMVAQVAETLSGKVNGGQSGDSYPVEEILDQGTCVTVNSNSFAENTLEFQAAVSCASAHGDGEPDSYQVTEFVVPLPDRDSGAEVQGDEFISKRDLRTSFPGKTSDSQEENTYVQDEKQEIVGQVAETVSIKGDTDQSTDSCPIDEILDQGTYVTVTPNSFADDTVGSPVAIACGSPHGEGEPDSSRVIEFVGPMPDLDAEVQGAESIPIGDLRTSSLGTNSDSQEVTTCMQDEKQEMVSQIAETLSNKVDGEQSMDSGPIEEIPVQGTCVTVNSSSFAEVGVGSHAAVACAPHGEGELESSQDIVFVGLFPDSNPAADILVTGTCDSLPHEEQNTSSYVSESVTNHGVDNKAMKIEIKAKDGSCASEAMDSQFSIDDSNMGNLVVDLDICPAKNGNWKSGDEAVKEHIYPPDESHSPGAKIKEMGGDLGFSMTKCLDENADCEVTQVGSNGTQEIEIEVQVTDIEQQKSIDKKIVKQGDIEPGSCVKKYQASYCLPPESECEFSVYDLVWGKVRSHPWWPGQIFDPSDSSEQAIKYHKKGSFLVAYFGDRTFAWNEASLLKPFRTHFSQMEKQSNSKAFHDAVGCAVDEVSRRVELGLTCSCMSEEEDNTKIKSQIVKNTGIREESSKRDGLDKSAWVISFEPDKLVEYLKALALFPSGGGNRLELVIAQAQLLAFYRSKGYCGLPEFQVFGGLLDNDAVSSFSGEKKHSNEAIEHAISVSKDEEQVPCGKGKSKSQDRYFRKRKRNLEDSVYPSKKERSLSELMAGDKGSLYYPHGQNESDGKATGKSVSLPSRKKRKAIDSFSDETVVASSYYPHGQNESDGKATGKSISLPSRKKRKAIDSFSDESVVQNRKKGLSSSGAANTMSLSPKQSFKVGERIRRVASQLTGSPPILKSSGERFLKSAAKVNGSNKKPAGAGFGVSPHTTEESHRRRMFSPTEYSSPGKMLSQLYLAALDPMKGYNFLAIIISFFSNFRNSISLEQSDSRKHKKSVEKVGGGKTGRKSKLSNGNNGSAETFAFEDMKDSYWTDMVIQSSPEEQPSRKNQNIKGVSQPGTSMENDMPTDELENFLLNPNWDYTQQNPDGNYGMPAEKPGGHADLKCREDFSPTALILSFTELDSVPSERNLNNIFKRFGPLRESETEVLRETSCARVVFKKGSDAEVAFSSAGKFSIFGPAAVSYQLSYLSSTPSNASSGVKTQCGRDATSMEGNIT
ncbi:hypothetical protein HHK36_018947 [Tetracentron sinense]|uniref:PWWP domain-containing protein n=1 Tax=Tetracentron sinense TaxID=13715 RepID=A0A835D949_TETSI|nr:hypothetical protein HHK36_018947 [Tetracentron sinense]